MDVSCTDRISEKTKRQHGESQQTHFIQNMRAHVTHIYMANAQEDHNRMNTEKKKKNRKETYELIQLCPSATRFENGMNSFNLG